MALQCAMSGGSPWGFKMTGGKDFHLPLSIAKVTHGGKAYNSGIVVGYIIEKINGEDCSTLYHHEAQNKIKSSGANLTLTLSKPKRRDTLPEASTTENKSTTAQQARSKSPEYKPDPARLKQYSNPGKWQREGGVTQSPALYVKTQKASKAASTPVTNGDKPLSFSPEIKQMIEEEESRRNNEPEVKTGNIKTWEPQSQRSKSPSPTLPPLPDNIDQSFDQSKDAALPPPPDNIDQLSDKTKAANSIGKFFQSSSGPRYCEPTFTKALQDVARPLGDPAVLEVRLGPALPVPTVHWYHNNKPSRESKEKDIRFLSNGPIHTLLLGELTPELLGTYTCTIMNKYGSKSCRCQVLVEGGKGRHHSQGSYGRAAVQPTTVVDGKKVTPSTSVGLYSNRSANDTYQSQLNRRVSRDSNEESEVLKALREQEPQKSSYKTPTMKYLQDSLLPESDDL